jgi:uncharacterized membrane-anchored protein
MRIQRRKQVIVAAVSQPNKEHLRRFAVNQGAFVEIHVFTDNDFSPSACEFPNLLVGNLERLDFDEMRCKVAAFLNPVSKSGRKIGINQKVHLVNGTSR